MNQQRDIEQMVADSAADAPRLSEHEQHLLGLIDRYLAGELALPAFTSEYQEYYIDIMPPVGGTPNDDDAFLGDVNLRLDFIDEDALPDERAAGLKTEAEFRDWLRQARDDVSFAQVANRAGPAPGAHKSPVRARAPRTVVSRPDFPIRAAVALSPKSVHALDQLGAALRETARELAAYNKELVDGGMSSAQAWALTQRLEERLLGPVIDHVREQLDADKEAGPYAGPHVD